MAWIKSHQEIERHAKLYELRSKLNWSKNETIGFLHRFWWMVLEASENGDVTKLSPEFVAEQLSMKVEQIRAALDAMVNTGWIDQCEGDILVIHDWLDHAGKYLRESKCRSDKKKWEKIESFHKSLNINVMRLHDKCDARLDKIRLDKRKEKQEKENDLCVDSPDPETPKPPAVDPDDGAGLIPECYQAMEGAFSPNAKPVLEAWAESKAAAGLPATTDKNEKNGAALLAGMIDAGEITLAAVKPAMREFLKRKNEDPRKYNSWSLKGFANSFSSFQKPTVQKPQAQTGKIIDVKCPFCKGEFTTLTPSGWIECMRCKKGFEVEKNINGVPP